MKYDNQLWNKRGKPAQEDKTQEDKQRGRARPMQEKGKKNKKRGKVSEEKKESKEVMHSKKKNVGAG